MKDIVSLLLTTSCLAIAGIGIYFFSYKSDEDEDVTQKAGKKKNLVTGKKQSESKDTYYENDYDDNDNDDTNSFDNNHTDDDITNFDYKIKTKTKTKSNNKTKKHINKFASSKKRYYY